MITTTTTFVRLVNIPETSSVIGMLTSQERPAYNHAVNILNREPMMPKRARKGSRHGLNKRITRWRNEDLAARRMDLPPITSTSRAAKPRGRPTP